MKIVSWLARLGELSACTEKFSNEPERKEKKVCVEKVCLLGARWAVVGGVGRRKSGLPKRTNEADPQRLRLQRSATRHSPLSAARPGHAIKPSDELTPILRRSSTASNHRARLVLL